MKQKKGLIVGLIVALLAVFAVASVVGYKVFQQVRHRQALHALTEELNKMEGVISNQAFTDAESSQILDRTVSKGDYAVLERAVKDHCKDLFAKQNEMTQYLEKNEIEQYLTPEALASDAPNFETTTQKLAEFRETEKNLRESWLYLASEEGIRQYQSAQLKGDLKKLFDEYVENVTSSDVQSVIESDVAYYNQTMDAIGQALEYLKNNQSSWVMENGQILFNTEESLNAYNAILSQIPE